MQQAVIRARPDHPLLVGRVGEGEDGVIDLDARDVGRDRAARAALFRGVVAREVRADRLPCLALVAAAQQHLSGMVEGVGILT